MSLLRSPLSRACVSLVALALLVSLAPVRAAEEKSAGGGGDWPQWQGPNRDAKSTETGLLKEWPEGGPPLAWKIKGVGVGFSTVSVVGKRIFTMGDQADGAYVVALDENGGAKEWATRIGKSGGEYKGTRCTPTVDGDFVYALGQFADLVCLQVADGKEVWHKNLQSDFGGRVMSAWNFTESPLVDGERLVCTPGGDKGTMLALNKRTGETIWRSAEIKDAASYSSIVPAEIGGQKQYVQLTAEHVFGVARESGKLLWSAARRGGTAVIPTPIVHGNEVFVTSGYGAGCNLFRITGAGSGDFKAEEVYRSNVMSNHHGGCVLVDKHIYGSSDPGILKCIEWETGKEVWKDRAPGKGSVLYADGMLYCRNEGGAGTIFLVEASPAGYKEHGHFDQPDRSSANAWPHPVIAGGKLYLRDQDVLLCYDVKAK